VDLQLYTGRSLDVITQAETMRAYGEPLSGDYPRYTSGVAMLETAERFTPVEKEPALRQFLLLVGGLRALGEGVHDPRLVLDAFMRPRWPNVPCAAPPTWPVTASTGGAAGHACSRSQRAGRPAGRAARPGRRPPRFTPSA